MRFNMKITKRGQVANLAGGMSYKESPELELAAILLTSFAKDQFYRKGDDTIDRLAKLISRLSDKSFAAKAGILARNEYGMRSITHVLAGEIARQVKGEEWTKRFVQKIIHRPDDATEIMAYYLSKYGKPVPNSLKRGVGLAMAKFDGYQLAKYRASDAEVSLVDVVNLVHPRPVESNSEALASLVKDELRSSGTWEFELTSAGQSAEPKEVAKAQAWEKLIGDRKIGYFALLRNLRNILMQAEPDIVEAALKMLVDEQLIRRSLVMPFRFTTAFTALSGVSADGTARAIEAVSDALDISLCNVPDLPGRTLIALDVSGSMCGRPIEVGSLFAAALYKKLDAELLMFATDAQYVGLNRRDSTLGMAQLLRGRATGGGTNFHSIFAKANKGYRRIIILSDMQGWMGHDAPTKSFAKYKKRAAVDPMVYSFDLAGYGTLQFPERNVFCLAGMSDKVFDTMKLLESDPDALLHRIEAVQL